MTKKMIGLPRPELIAEIGWNHMGDMDLAKQMIESAKKHGADTAKFQTWSVQRLAPGEWDRDGRREIYEKAELSKDKHIELIRFCQTMDINFLSSACSLVDAKLLLELGVKRVKIPSPDCRNIEMIGFCITHFSSVLVSTGTATMEDIEAIIGLPDADKKITLFHCVSSYPCPPERANLPRIQTLKKRHPRVGYSDHSQGITCTVLSLAYQPVALEKHFTIDRQLPGRDNKFAILPEDLSELKKALDLWEQVNIDWGNDYQDIESGARQHYAERFDWHG